ncbi:carbohydrate ABC transporter membrane protein 1 (CUT1 family) [Kineothrix alysoides]|uniref:Carbohydrate ABC transporter membrane protein 1 (CUT1 family) n=1 Tax=Kineothrix alysoides TaxID=1469948 RepID=A0A4R1QW69_9FIRM|nr:sugar ABC transporter permease [Kineothrix alysoides]TCL56965.1 carbohydrate ABC transporter membrane protein 1 (CUT1 family) [Kineothrix alysoides]
MQSNKREKREQILGYFFIVPAVIYMLTFIGYPIAYNWMISFQDVTAKTLGSAARDFVGFDNYKLIFMDLTFRKALLHTFVYTVGCLIIQFSLGFLFAMFFAKKFTLSKAIRGFIVISWMLPVTVTALVFKFMFAESNGIINAILMNLHIIEQPIGWLLQGNTAMLGLIIANSWVGIPFNMLLLTTGLNNIPGDIYEAASIDGASGTQKFFKITIPLLKPTIMSVLVLGFVLTFKVFDLVYVMTGGGPVDATEVLSTYSYKLSFQLFHFGEGAAAANVLFVCLFLVALVYLKTISKDEVI